MTEVGFDPKRSKVGEEALAEFIRNPVNDNLMKVPGIGEAAVKLLAKGAGDDCVTTTSQLIGKFLMLRGTGKDGEKVDSVEHCDRFWYWLQSRGVNSHRSGIVNAVAEKANTWIPGIYDADIYTTN